MPSNLCEHCTAVCCHYIALPIDEPRTRRDFDDIRWYVMHQGVTVFKEDGDWYIQVETPCTNLMPDRRCGVYETRPEICREYKAGDCDYEGGDYTYEFVLKSAEDVEEQARKVLGARGDFNRSPSGEPRDPSKNGITRSHRDLVRLKVRLRNG